MWECQGVVSAVLAPACGSCILSRSGQACRGVLKSPLCSGCQGRLQLGHTAAAWSLPAERSRDADLRGEGFG